MNRGTMNSLPKTVTRQRRGCDLNPGPTAPESNTLTTHLLNFADNPIVKPHNRGHREEGINVLVAYLLIRSITQSSKPNQRTNDATC